MIVARNSSRNSGYSRNKKFVIGRGFTDTLSNALAGVKTYLSTNRDLIAKPLLSAVGSLGALGISAGVPSLIRHIAERNRKKPQPTPTEPMIMDDAKYKEILENLGKTTEKPVENIMGASYRRKTGSGIKIF
jgi:hypothetical protein